MILITGHGDVPMAVEAMRVGAYRFSGKAVQPRPDDRAGQARHAGAADDAGQPGAAQGTVGRHGADEEADRRLAGHGAAARGYPRSGAGRRPCADRWRDRHRQDPGRPCAACRRPAGGQEVRHDLLRGLVRGPVGGRDSSARREDGATPAGRRGARRHALPGGYRSAEPGPCRRGLLTVINEQGTPPETRIIAICNDHAPDKTVEDALRPDLYYRLGAMKIVLPPLRSRGEDILTLFTRMSEAVCRGIRLRGAAGHGAGGGATVAGALAGQCAAAGQYRRAGGAAEPARLGLDRLAADGGQRGGGPGDDHRGQAAEGICRGVRADADRQHDAAPQGLDRGGDG